MAGEGKRLTWKFYLCFFVWTAALGCGGYFLLWDEIKKIQDLIPESNREGKDNCYENPLLSVQIWTRENHFYPFYKMQDVVQYFDCLGNDEALDVLRNFYIIYYTVAIVLLMGFFSFILVLSKYPWKYAVELVILPMIFGIGEGVFIFFLAGNYKNDGVGGLSEIYCQLCSSVGLIFWVLLAFILIISICGLSKQCCHRFCSRDRQGGEKIKTLRANGSNIFSSETEMEPGRAKSGLF